MSIFPKMILFSNESKQEIKYTTFILVVYHLSFNVMMV